MNVQRILQLDTSVIVSQDPNPSQALAELCWSSWCYPCFNPCYPCFTPCFIATAAGDANSDGFGGFGGGDFGGGGASGTW